MYREFVTLVSETVDEAHANGIALFYESLEKSLQVDNILENHGIEATLREVFMESTSDQIEYID